MADMPSAEPYLPSGANLPQAVRKEGCEAYRPLLEKYGWDVEIALKVMQAESGCNPKAYNPESHTVCRGSYSLMQVSCEHYLTADYYNPALNVALAYRVYTSLKYDGTQVKWDAWGVCISQLVKCE